MDMEPECCSRRRRRRCCLFVMIVILCVYSERTFLRRDKREDVNQRFLCTTSELIN